MKSIASATFLKINRPRCPQHCAQRAHKHTHTHFAIAVFQIRLHLSSHTPEQPKFIRDYRSLIILLLPFQYIPAGHRIPELTLAMFNDPKTAIRFTRLKYTQRIFTAFTSFRHIHEAHRNQDLPLAMFTQPIVPVRYQLS